MHGTPLLRRMALALGLALLAAQPALANCSAANESCTSSCNGSLTSGFIVGLAGALGRNNQAYQEGQRQLQQAEACAQRCSAQYDACYQQEQAQRQQEEAARRAQQQRADAQQRAEQQRAQAQLRAQAEREALKRRVNRVISPPVTPPLAIKDAAPLLQQAQAHDKEGNPFAAAHIYKMVIQSSTQPKHLQVARAALRRHALDELIHMGTREPGAYARILGEYEPLGVFNTAEQLHLENMAPHNTYAEDSARDYLSRNAKGTLRGVAESVANAAPELRAREVEEKQRTQHAKLQEEEKERLERIRTVPPGKSRWVAVKGGCQINDTLAPGTFDITWTGGCKDGFAEGIGVYQHLNSQNDVLYNYEGELVRGKQAWRANMN